MGKDEEMNVASLGTGDVGQVIRRRRQETGISAEAVCKQATRAGYPVKVPTLYQWETGTRSIPLAALPYLAAGLQCRAADLVAKMNCRRTKVKLRE